MSDSIKTAALYKEAHIKFHEAREALDAIRKNLEEALKAVTEEQELKGGSSVMSQAPLSPLPWQEALPDVMKILDASQKARRGLQAAYSAIAEEDRQIYKHPDHLD